VDESDHLALVNAGDEEVVSQEAAAEGEGGCCCASAIAIAHMRAHRARENSTRLGRVALTGGPVCVWGRGACPLLTSHISITRKLLPVGCIRYSLRMGFKTLRFFARYLAGRLERPAVLPCVVQTRWMLTKLEIQS